MSQQLLSSHSPSSFTRFEPHCSTLTSSYKFTMKTIAAVSFLGFASGTLARTFTVYNGQLPRTSLTIAAHKKLIPKSQPAHSPFGPRSSPISTSAPPSPIIRQVGRQRLTAKCPSAFRTSGRRAVSGRAAIATFPPTRDRRPARSVVATAAWSVTLAPVQASRLSHSLSSRSPPTETAVSFRGIQL
jgi:hypothetical protein